MCKACTTLFYGTFVKAIPLFMAAEAWTRAKPVFVALDMISRRRSKGDLHVVGAEEGRTTIASLPVEVLELVKKAVVDVEVGRAEYALAARVVDPDEGDSLGKGCFFPFECVCEWCWYSFFENGGMWDLTDEHKKVHFPRLFFLSFADTALLQDVQCLVYDFGLRWPGLQLFGRHPGTFSDTDSLAALAFPFHHSPTSDDSTYLDCEHDVAHDADEAHSFTKIDPAIFLLPNNTFSRFHRFLSLFNLYTYDITTSTLTLASSSSRRTPSSATASSVDSTGEAKPGAPKPLAGPLSLNWHVGSWSVSCM
ncbi:hypothetical protein JCM8097_000327 [Rhodosporidiobolus ruineniae]